MLDYLKPMQTASGQRQPAMMPPAAAQRILECESALRNCGLTPGILKVHGGSGSSAGISLRVPVRLALDSHEAMQRLNLRVQRCLQGRVPLTLYFTDLGHGDTATTSLETVCQHIRRSVADIGQQHAAIGTSIQSHQVPLQAYLLICTVLLGRGPHYVLLDSLQMQHHVCDQVQHESERNWDFLWQQRSSDDRVIPAYAAAVRTPCPLLSDEATGGVLPGHGIQVPDDSAWLPIDLPLDDFADDNGELSWAALNETIAICVDAGEQLLDLLRWSDAQQRHDARHNRRLAISLSGIGDLVLRRRADPADLECLLWLSQTIGRIHAEFWSRSKLIASESELLPALVQSDPSTRWDDAKHRSDWRARWHKALENSAVRHRNLLVMSPYSVLPSGSDNMAPFTDLLPVLEYADAFSFADPPAFSGWNIKEFKHFHRRAWAIIQRQKSASFVAAGV